MIHLSAADPFLALRDLVVPRDCLACRDALPAGWPRAVCDGCLSGWESLSFDGVPLCPACALPEPAGVRCGRCQTKPRAFDAASAFGRHEGALRAAVLALKFRGAIALADPLAGFLARAARRLPPATRIVPAPQHRRRLRGRAFNQASVLADRLAARLGLPVEHDALRRVLHTAPQTSRGRAGRAGNLRDAIAADGARVDRAVGKAHGACHSGFALEGHAVLLVDDVMTTCATADACAIALKRAGARDVSVVTVTRR